MREIPGLYFQFTFVFSVCFLFHHGGFVHNYYVTNTIMNITESQNSVSML